MRHATRPGLERDPARRARSGTRAILAERETGLRAVPARPGPDEATSPRPGGGRPRTCGAARTGQGLDRRGARARVLQQRPARTGGARLRGVADDRPVSPPTATSRWARRSSSWAAATRRGPTCAWPSRWRRNRALPRRAAARGVAATPPRAADSRFWPIRVPRSWADGPSGEPLSRRGGRGPGRPTGCRRSSWRRGSRPRGTRGPRRTRRIRSRSSRSSGSGPAYPSIGVSCSAR